MELVMKKELNEKGYSVVPNILSKSYIENYLTFINLCIGFL